MARQRPSRLLLLPIVFANAIGVFRTLSMDQETPSAAVFSQVGGILLSS